MFRNKYTLFCLKPWNMYLNFAGRNVCLYKSFFGKLSLLSEYMQWLVYRDLRIGFLPLPLSPFLPPSHLLHVIDDLIECAATCSLEFLSATHTCANASVWWCSWVSLGLYLRLSPVLLDSVPFCSLLRLAQLPKHSGIVGFQDLKGQKELELQRPHLVFFSIFRSSYHIA